MRTRFPIKALTLIVAAVSFAVPRICTAQNVGPTPAGPHVLPAVVTLHVQRADGGTATGTGFLGVRDGLLVTTLHVLEDAARVTATFPDGEVFDCIGIVDRDARHNVALVRVREFGRPMLAISPAEMKVGDKVSAAVVKDGAFGLVDAGVDSVMIPGGVKFYRLTAQIPDGNNGAPVVDAVGAVLGMAMSITVNDQTFTVALPSSYILALEPSLPVKPWTPAASPAASGAAPAGAASAPANDPADTVLAAAFRQVHDLWAYYTPFSQGFYNYTRYNNTKSLNLYSVQSAIDVAIQRLEWLRPSDPVRAMLARADSQFLASERQAIGLEIQCWLLEKDVGPDKNIPEAKNAAEQASAVFASVPAQVAALQPTLRQFAASSPAFLAALSPEMRHFLGITPRKSKLDLGVYVPSDTPMELIGVVHHGLADKLGLQAGDSIVSAGGQAFTPQNDMDDFAVVIEANAGRRLEIVVKRGDKMKTLSKNVPADVVQEYGGA